VIFVVFVVFVVPAWIIRISRRLQSLMSYDIRLCNRHVQTVCGVPPRDLCVFGAASPRQTHTEKGCEEQRPSRSPLDVRLCNRHDPNLAYFPSLAETLPRFNASTLPRFNASTLQRFNASTLPRSHAPPLQRSPARSHAPPLPRSPAPPLQRSPAHEMRNEPYKNIGRADWNKVFLSFS
jgi:hypothetical protein